MGEIVANMDKDSLKKVRDLIDDLIDGGTIDLIWGPELEFVDIEDKEGTEYEDQIMDIRIY